MFSTIFTPNFTLSDTLSALLGTFLFPIVTLFPGYVAGWAFDLFGFRQRLFGTRLAIAILLSLAMGPVFFYLIALFLSLQAAVVCAGILAVIFFLLFFAKEQVGKDVRWGFFAGIGAAWTIFVIVSLVNIQWGDQLWLSVVTFDQTGRVSIIDAITRTGVPPINPSYYPGEAVLLTYLYYFWYVLCSLVDLLGGRLVDARAALVASSVWSGVGLISVVSLYLRLRNGNLKTHIWRGVLLLTVSGLDILPAMLLMLATRQIIGSVDVWNTWIVSWIGSALWVPHHLAALTAGLTALLLLQYARQEDISYRRAYPLFSGWALASVAGLSIWVVFVFAIFWVIWLIVLLFKGGDRFSIFAVFFSALAALLISTPFLVGLVQSPSLGTGFPIAFEVRSFLQLETFTDHLSFFWRSLVMLMALPVNYLMELGFFGIAGMYWLSTLEGRSIVSNSYTFTESLLLAVTLGIASFLRSTIGSNDLGWRTWLVGQFVLLVWGVDIWIYFSASSSISHMRTKRILLVFMLLGISTSVIDAALLRTAWPFMTSIEESRRYYSARIAYEYIRDHTRETTIVQNNPFIFVDRPSGLYGARQMVVSSRTPYEMDMADDFEQLMDGVGSLFLGEMVDWCEIDRVCDRYCIDVLVLSDTDPIWQNMTELKAYRVPMYENEHYAVFACGK